MDHETFEPLGRWEVDRGPQQLAYDAWWHLGYDTMVTSEWGTPDTFENGLVPEMLLGSKYGRRLHFWDLTRRKHLQEIDFGEEHQLVFELRPAHDPTKAYGFVNCVISLKDLSSSIWTWYRDGDKWAVKKVITIPAEPADPDDLPPVLKGFRRRARRSSPTSTCRWTTAFSTSPAGAPATCSNTTCPTRSIRSSPARCGSAASSRARPPGAKNGKLAGGPQMVEISRDGRRVYFTNSLYGAIDPQFYDGGFDGWMVKLDAEPGRRHRLRSEVLHRMAEGPPAAPGPARRAATARRIRTAIRERRVRVSTRSDPSLLQRAASTASQLGRRVPVPRIARRRAPARPRRMRHRLCALARARRARRCFTASTRPWAGCSRSALGLQRGSAARRGAGAAADRARPRRLGGDRAAAALASRAGGRRLRCCGSPPRVPDRFGAWHVARGYRHAVAGRHAGRFLRPALWSFLMASAHGAGLMVHARAAGAAGGGGRVEPGPMTRSSRRSPARSGPRCWRWPCTPSRCWSPPGRSPG